MGKIPWRRKWQPTSVLSPGESHGQRSLAGYSPWGHKEPHTTWLLDNNKLWNLSTWKPAALMSVCLESTSLSSLDSVSSPNNQGFRWDSGPQVYQAWTLSLCHQLTTWDPEDRANVLTVCTTQGLEDGPKTRGGADDGPRLPDKGFLLTPRSTAHSPGARNGSPQSSLTCGIARTHASWKPPSRTSGLLMLVLK